MSRFYFLHTRINRWNRKSVGDGFGISDLDDRRLSRNQFNARRIEIAIFGCARSDHNDTLARKAVVLISPHAQKNADGAHYYKKYRQNFIPLTHLSFLLIPFPYPT